MSERRRVPRRAVSTQRQPDRGGGRAGATPSAEVPPGDVDATDEGNLAVALDRDQTLDLLAEGELEIVGRLVEASNLNLYCRITRRCPDPEPDTVAACVYKPIAGERPLDDFPDGTLANREVAAYRVSESMGWNIVPPTILRDGPVGPGMVQLWVDIDESVEVIDLIRGGHPAMRRMAVFDAVINNADRKGGHMLPAGGGHIYGVDHGVCFSPDPKLRTILWGWRGQRFTADEIDALTELEDATRHRLGDELRELLTPDEVEAMKRRLHRLRATGRFPQPDPNRPAIPWPPF